MQLWAIEEALQQMIDEATDQETGEIEEHALHDIELLELDREKKLLALAGYVKGERAEGRAVLDQATALTERARKHSARADRLEEFVRRHLPEGESIRDDRSWLKWRKSRAVIVDDMAQLPVELVVHPPRPDPRPDKVAIRKALKAGDISGAHIEHRMKLVIE